MPQLSTFKWHQCIFRTKNLENQRKGSLHADIHMSEKRVNLNALTVGVIKNLTALSHES